MLDSLRRFMEELVYPPPPNHYKPCKNGLECTLDLTYSGTLAAFKMVLIIIVSFAINRLIRARRTGGNEICTRVVRNPVSVVLLRFWFPPRLLCPSLFHEFGMILRYIVERLPNNVTDLIIPGLTRTELIWEWTELLGLIFLMICLLDGPLNVTRSRLGQWCISSFDERPTKRSKRPAQSTIRVVQEPIVGLDRSNSLSSTTTDDTNAMDIASNILDNLVDREDTEPSTRNTRRINTSTIPKRIEATITTTDKLPRRTSRKR